MGNYSSCLFKPSKPAAKFIDSDGNLRRINVPAKVAELMIESPGHVICTAEELLRTRRVMPMKAEEELQRGMVYLLLPVTRINARVSEDEISRIDATCRKRGKKGGRWKVFPEEERGNGGNLLHVEDGGESDTVFPRLRINSCRQWRPVLETISEGC